MRSRRRIALVLSLTGFLISASFAGLAEAKRHPHPVKATPPSPLFTQLGRLQSLEVQPVEGGTFSLAHRQAPPPEIAEYIRAALQHNDRLPYASPGEGVLRLRCDNDRCDRIRAEVSLKTPESDAEGPIVWHAVHTYRPAFMHFLPDAQQFARQLVSRLSDDYEQAVRVTPVKIEIQDE